MKKRRIAEIFGLWAALPRVRNRGHDDIRLNLFDFPIAEPQLFHHPRAEILYHHIANGY